MYRIYMDKGYHTPVKCNPCLDPLDLEQALDAVRGEAGYQADISGCEIEYAGKMAILRNRAGRIKCRIWAARGQSDG